MRTSLKYSVLKEERYDYQKDKMVSFVKSRGYEFMVSGAKSEQEHNAILDDFESYLRKHGYESYGFGTDNFHEAYLDIPVSDMDAKEEIKELYAEWKAQRKGN